MGKEWAGSGTRLEGLWSPSWGLSFPACHGRGCLGNLKGTYPSRSLDLWLRDPHNQV